MNAKKVIIDLGSNTFRLVVFSYVPGLWWQHSDEIYEAVRIGAGLNGDGTLKEKPVKRALAALEVFAHFCRAQGLTDITAVATSAIRDAKNRTEFLERAEATLGSKIRVLSTEEEAYYGHLAATNSMIRGGVFGTMVSAGLELSDEAFQPPHCVLDLGGGSLQLTEVRLGKVANSSSWRLGAVRMTERFFSEQNTETAVTDLRKHVKKQLAKEPWLKESKLPTIIGIGGTVRNLAAAAQHLLGMPSIGVQGFLLSRTVLQQVISELESLPSSKRGSMAGIKPQRGDVILAGAVVLDAVLKYCELEQIEVTEAGLREGTFFAGVLTDHFPGSLLAPELPVFSEVRRQSVLNLLNRYDNSERQLYTHSEQIAKLAVKIYHQLVALGQDWITEMDLELLWAAAQLHDIGMSVSYDDHHKHSRYLVLNSGLPGFTQREAALIAQIARYHRKGTPSLGWLKPLAEKGDERLLTVFSLILRISEELEHARDFAVEDVKLSHSDGRLQFELEGKNPECLRLAAMTAQPTLNLLSAELS